MTIGPLDLLEKIAAMLDELSIPYALGGSFAASFFGEPRATADIDVAIVADVVAGELLLDRAGAEFYVPVAAAREAIRSGGSFNMIPNDSAMKVDLFPLGAGRLDRRQIERRVQRALPSGASVWVTAPEDIVLRKLDWFREGGESSERQWGDIVAILSVTGERLDRADMVQAAVQLGLIDLLRRAAGDADLAL